MNIRRLGGRRRAALRVGCWLGGLLGTGLLAASALHAWTTSCSAPANISQFCYATAATITLTLADFGLVTMATALPEGTIVATQLQPLDTLLSSPSVTVPNMGGSVAADGTLTSPDLVDATFPTVPTNYIWRFQLTAAQHDPPPPTFAITAESYVLSNSSGTNKGAFSHSVYPTSRLKVELIPGALSDQKSANRWYVYRAFGLKMDLNGIKYSGNYTGTIQSTITY